MVSFVGPSPPRSSVAEICDSLGVDPHLGHTDQHAAELLSECGPNVLPAPRGRSTLMMILAQFHNPLIYVLLGSVVVTLVIGHLEDAFVILGVVLVNALIGFIQENRANRALASLAALTAPAARVIRSGCVCRIPAAEVVVGDVLLLEAGERVAADARVMQVRGLADDESALTGEAVPVLKSAEVLASDLALADQVNMVFAGTLVAAGRGTAVVTATGENTELGHISELVETAVGVQTPLTRKLARFSAWLTVVILGLAVITLILGVVRGESIGDMVVAAVALAVGAIPEGLPAAVTITLAIGVARMSRRKAIMRRLPAAETLGSTTVICTDKTGTLTLNRMTVEEIYAKDGAHWPDEEAVASASPGIRDCLLAGVLCNDASVGSGPENHADNVGDPTELALVAIAHRVAPDLIDVAARWERIAEIPFTSDLKYMATLHSGSVGEHRLVVKGALEQVLGLCAPVAAEQELAVLAVADRMAGDALRVLAFAWADVGANFELSEAGIASCGLSFLGVQAMHDPPRPEAVRAVQVCHEAGIAVKMVTGDHARTAEAIGREIGLVRDRAPVVMTSADLAAVDAASWDQVISGTDIFARVSAEQKLRIVEGLQRRGEIVAMTGDGVNDAPALRQADIGIAMGVGGTEVAKDTADMVLLDDNFATIEAAVEEGRGVFDNLTKFITWTLPTNLGEGLVILAAIVLGVSLPILPVQILWINMTTAVALGLMLAFEPKERDIMKRPPRRPDQPIITAELLMRIVVVGGLMLVGAFGLYNVALDQGVGEVAARTIAVNAFVAMEIGYLFNCRSLNRSVLSVGLFSNPWIWVGVGATVLLQLVFTYLPAMNAVFDTTPITGQWWLAIIGLGVVLFAVIGAMKWVSARFR